MTNLTRSHSIESVVGLLPLYICPFSSLFSDAGPTGSALISISAALCGLVFLLKQKDVVSTLRMGWPFVALALCYAVSLAGRPSFPGLKHLLAALSIALFFCFYIQNGWAIRRNPVFLFGAILAGIAFIIPSLAGVNEKNFDGGMAFYGLSLALFLILGNKSTSSNRGRAMVFTFGVAASLYAVWIDFRMLATYGALLIFLYAGLSWKPELTKFYRALLAALGAMIGAIVFFYANIENSPYLSDVNEFFIRTTDRSALSGRQILWPAIINAVSDHPWFGLGAGVLPSDIINTEFSAHNYYLQVMLQVGLFGLLLAISCIYCIWKALLAPTQKSASLIFAISILIIFILHNASEVLMFQNALRVSIPAWILLFIAASTNIRTSGRLNE